MAAKETSVIRKLFLSDTEKTFQYDDTLPSLPIPNLDQTLDRYLMWSLPHVSEEEYKTTEKIVDDFRKNDGPKLHKMLQEYAKDKKNWLDHWWLKYAYLSSREPILPTTNTTGPQVIHDDIWPPSLDKALEYASIFVWLTVEFFHLLRQEKVRPQHSVKGTRFSMNQFRKVFNTCRIPHEGLDEIVSWWKTESEGDCPNHLIVLCHGYIWVLNVWDSKGELITAPEIEVQLRHIRERSDKMGRGPGVAALTCDNRDTWAKNRNWLKSISRNNSKNLELIESSVFSFVLDDSTPKNFEELCWEGLCGDTSNRWADKSLSGISTRNGFTSMNNDHSPYDAMVSVMIANFQYEVIMSDMKGRWQGSNLIRNHPMPVLLNFDIDSNIESAIKSSKLFSQNLINNVGASFHRFSKYGKLFIKESKIHPDAYIQLSLQLAYYKLHKKPAPTYETATTRQYYNARTETMRSCTPEAYEWVKSMTSNNASVLEKKQLLVKAASRHRELMIQCQDGQGIDRHLLGLYIIALENNIPIPELFMDPTFVKSGGGGNYILSTSTIGYTPIVGGVAAMCRDGYGVFYSILPTSVSFFVSYFKDGDGTSSDGLCRSIDSSLQDMKNLLSPVSKL